jgi:hypothetical protein
MSLVVKVFSIEKIYNIWLKIDDKLTKTDCVRVSAAVWNLEKHVHKVIER